jgi:hypothetical protein
LLLRALLGAGKRKEYKKVLTEFSKEGKLIIMIKEVINYVKQLQKYHGRPKDLPIFVPDCGWNHGEDLSQTRQNGKKDAKGEISHVTGN